LSLNGKTPTKTNNEGIDHQLSLSNQYEIVSNFFVPLKKLRYISSYLPKLIISNCFEVTKTRASLRNINGHFAFVSQIKPKSFLEIKKKDEKWILAIQDELNQFEINSVWELVPIPNNQSIMGTKWCLETKLMNMEQ